MVKLSPAVNNYCKNAIAHKLTTLNIKETLSSSFIDFVWETALTPNSSIEQVTLQLRPTLGNDAADFVKWMVDELSGYITGEIQVPQLDEYDMRINNFNYTNTEQNDNQMHPVDNSLDNLNNGVRYAENNYNIPVNSSVNKVQYDKNQKLKTNSYTSAARPGYIDVANTKQKIKKRCLNFPNCPLNEKCPYIHPEEMCKSWPRCSYGVSCFYLHPEVPCKYGINCPKSHCCYTHPSEWSPQVAASRYNSYTGTFKNVTYRPSN